MAEEDDLSDQGIDMQTFGAVGPSNDHARQSSAGTVVLPVLEETKSELQNLTPTVPSAKLDLRPSIFDMRKQKKQGSFRATSYDKLARSRPAL